MTDGKEENKARETTTTPATTGAWGGGFGTTYSERNAVPVDYVARYGTTREAMFHDIFGFHVAGGDKILEIGCNNGNQIAVLQGMGFTRVQGIDINPVAVALANERGFDVQVGDAARLPFPDKSFDLVFTAGVLIHVPAPQLRKVMEEAVRVSRRHVAGFEYFARDRAAIPYRDGVGLWKDDFAARYITYCPVSIIEQRLFPYKDGSGNVDTGFLLRKEEAWHAP